MYPPLTSRKMSCPHFEHFHGSSNALTSPCDQRTDSSYRLRFRALSNLWDMKSPVNGRDMLLLKKRVCVRSAPISRVRWQSVISSYKGVKVGESGSVESSRSPIRCLLLEHICVYEFNTEHHIHLVTDTGRQTGSVFPRCVYRGNRGCSGSTLSSFHALSKWNW